MIKVRVGQDLKVDLEVEEVDSPVEEDSREESLTRVPPLRDPKYLAKLKIKIKTDAIIVTKEVTLQRSVPERNKGQAPKSSEWKKFEDYTYTYSGAEEPQLATATAIPQAYENALAAMRQSLKNQDPLQSLNM